MRPLLRVALVAVVLLSSGAIGAQQPTLTLTIESLELAVDRMLEARPYPPDPRLTPALLQDKRLLQAALGSQDGAVRALAVRSVGRFENPSDLTTLVPFLNEVSFQVRQEAAHGIIIALRRSGEPLPRAVSAVMYRAPEVSAMQEARLLLSKPVPPEFESSSPRVLVQVIRAEPSFLLNAWRLTGLHRSVRIGSPMPDPDALEILLRKQDYDVNELWYSARFRCDDPPGTPLGTCGWEVRFAPAALLDPNDPLLEPMLTLLATDPVFQVRLAALRQLALAIPRTLSCKPLLIALMDSREVPAVKVEAIRLLDPACKERVEIATDLALVAADLSGSSVTPPWVATRALEALPRFDAAEASRVVNERAGNFPLATVRASEARVAAALKDEARLLRLAADPDDNVRSEALGGLASIRSPRTIEFAIPALDSKDHRLIATAAAALTRSPDPERAAGALVFALRRLTAEGKDTSREARLAILKRLDELARLKTGDASMLATYAQDFLPLLKDFDPMVADAAASTLSLILGTRQDSQPTHRRPQQPTETELRSLPSSATIVMANDDRIQLELLKTEAPITVARFVKLVRDHYYDNTEFFRVSPLVTAQAGSPGGNDYSGDARFVRDELGLEHHKRGSVGLMTHGRDTGNMQFFIDLMDQPGLDHEYTVFARVMSGMSIVDALVEGSKIAKITVGPR
jgi:cyclophilin family peptidyl-prolyl cis-trans isomerase/HEAT repeat protein